MATFATAVLPAPANDEKKEERTVKYICLGYYDRDKSDALTEAERNATFDACFEYDEHLQDRGVVEAKQKVLHGAHCDCSS